MKTNETADAAALITDIQRFCMHDGPGIRTTVFFKGCPLRCRWCHNPETRDKRPEIAYTPSGCIGCGACAAACGNSAHIFTDHHEYDRSRCTGCGGCVRACPSGALTLYGKRVPVAEILASVEKDRPFYGAEGGLTVSGGEPTVQGKALTALLAGAKAAGITTALETCGVFPADMTGSLCRLTDLFLYDVKDTDADRLRDNTGAELSQVLSNLHAVDGEGCATVLRCIMIPGVNMNRGHCTALRGLYGSLSNCLYIELLPYHPYGAGKEERLGRPRAPVFGVPEKEDILAFAAGLADGGIPVKCFGTLPG